MKLYFAPGACSLAPHIVLNELGVQYELARVDLATKKVDGQDFWPINPKGYVPALQLDDGQVLTEVAVILQYLADLAPEKNLIPKAGTMERFRCLEWLNFVASEMHKAFSPLWDKNYPIEAKELIKRTLAKRFDYVREHLAKRDFLMGATFTVADAYLFTILNWTRFLKLDMTPWPQLMEYVERIRTRTSTATAIGRERQKI